MEKEHAHIDELIMDVLTGNAGRAQQDELEAWMAASEANRAYFERLHEIWFSAACSSDDRQFDGEAAFARFQRHVKAARQAASPTRPRPVGKFLRQAARYAAIVLLAAGTGGLAYQAGRHQAETPLAPIEITTPAGAQTCVSLPDGTQVILNAGSKLAYDADFGREGREVRLTGEGYFEVAHQAEMPFYVHSSDFRVKVLGTKFNICNYPDEGLATVSLLEGRVSLNGHGQPDRPLVLSPDEQAVWDKATARLSKQAMPADSDERAWWKDWLVFRDWPLERIVQVLQRDYDVRIEIEEGSLPAMRFNAEFRRSQSIETILDRLQATGKFRYERLNGSYYLYKDN